MSTNGLGSWFPALPVAIAGLLYYCNFSCSCCMQLGPTSSACFFKQKDRLQNEQSEKPCRRHSHCLFSLYYRSCKPGSITSSSSFSPTACSCLLVLIVLDAKNKLSHFCLGKIQVSLLFSRLPADADCFFCRPRDSSVPSDHHYHCRRQAASDH